MYIPHAFAEQDQAEIASMIDASAVAHLVTAGPDGLVASVVPLLVDLDAKTAVGHLARANPHGRSFDPDAQALAIFSGPDAYVSPSWYPTKAESGKVVPTWNYEVVHVYGALTVHDDPAWVADLVRRLTDRHESERTSPWSVDDAPEDYLATMYRAIVGIELKISRVEAKRKLSQNRPEPDRLGVIAGLESASVRERAVAVRMT